MGYQESQAIQVLAFMDWDSAETRRHANWFHIQEVVMEAMDKMLVMGHFLSSKCLTLKTYTHGTLVIMIYLLKSAKN